MSWDKNRKYDVPGRYNNDAGVPDRNASELFSSILLHEFLSIYTLRHHYNQHKLVIAKAPHLTLQICVRPIIIIFARIFNDDEYIQSFAISRSNSLCHRTLPHNNDHNRIPKEDVLFTNKSNLFTYLHTKNDGNVIVLS